MGILFFGAKNQQKYFTARTQNENSNNKKKRRRNKVGNSYNVSFWIEGMEKLLPTI